MDKGEHEASLPEEAVSWGVDMELLPVDGRLELTRATPYVASEYDIDGEYLVPLAVGRKSTTEERVSHKREKLIGLGATYMGRGSHKTEHTRQILQWLDMDN